MAIRKADSELDILYNYYQDILEDPACGALFIEANIGGRKIYNLTHGNNPVRYARLIHYLIDFNNKNYFVAPKGYLKKQRLVAS